MTNSRIHSFLTLLFIILPIFAVANQRSRFSFVSGTHTIIATISRQGKGFGENEVLSFRSAADGKLLMTMKSDGFEKPALFRYHGEYFMHVSTTPAGSGGFGTDTIFWIAPDATMHEIDFESAADAYESKVDGDEMVLAGGSGLDCTGGQLKFTFYIANEADPHCCPTAGKVTGSYEIVGDKEFDAIRKQYSSTFKMVITQFSRAPVSTPEMSASLAR